MLQFWKKVKQKSPNSSPQKVSNGSVTQNILDSELTTSVGPLSHFSHDITQSLPCDAKSRLTLCIEDLFNNKIALSYFSQYMEAHGLGNIFNLLMELENIPFKLSTCPPEHCCSLNSSPSKAGVVDSDCGRNARSIDGSNFSPKKVAFLYILDDAPYKVRLPEELRCEIQSACYNETFDLCFANLKTYIYQLIKKDVWMDFLKSDWYCKYQIEIMTSGKMTLSDVLYNDACLGSFIEFLESEGCGNVIEFWLAALQFQKQYHSKNNLTDAAQIQNDAILIYDKYLSLQAISPLGINDRVRFAVEEGICGETETSPTCLMPVVCLVEAFLRTSCLRLFFSSHQYLSLLSDVMSSSRLHSSPTSSVTEGSIDTRLPSEPDLFWRRRKQICGLSLGRIDSLGRYETDIEPEPNRKSESRLSRVVKLILNKDEQKTQEEMAWRVAEMIVKDITSITMGDSQSEEEL